MKPSRSFVWATVLLLSAIGPLRADEEIALPRGPQPQQLLARVARDHLILLTTTTEFRQEVRTVETNVGGQVVKKEVTVTVPIISSRETTSKLSDVQILGVDGKKVDEKIVAKKLKKRTPVLVSVNGQPVDPFYLKLIKEDTLIVVLPRLAEAPKRTPPKR
jgi:hypothetical protein